MGGFALGFEQAGFDVVAALEYDPIHAATHSFNAPRTSIVCADAAAVTGPRLRAAIEEGREAHGHRGAWSGEVAVVFGGPPCQGFSVGGKLAADDVRNSLVFEFARIVGLLQPDYFVLENVPAMRSAVDPRASEQISEDPGSLLGALYLDFDRRGYDVVHEEVLNACEHGVPQDRRRLIIVGVRRGTREPAFPSPSVRPAPKRTGATVPRTRLMATEGLPLGPTVKHAIGDLPNLDDHEELWVADEIQLPRSEWPARRGSRYARRLRGTEADPGDYSYGRSFDRSRLTSSLRTAHSLKTIQRFDRTDPGHFEPVSRFYRLDPAGLSGTLRAGTGYERGSFSAPRPIHPDYPRVISVREAARLHSFPDWFRFHVTKWHGFRQVGNSLPPLLGRAVAEELMSALEVEPTRPQQTIVLGDERLLRLDMTEAAAYFGVSLDCVPSHSLRLRARAAPVEDGDAEADQVA